MHLLSIDTEVPTVVRVTQTMGQSRLSSFNNPFLPILLINPGALCRAQISSCASSQMQPVREFACCTAQTSSTRSTAGSRHSLREDPSQSATNKKDCQHLVVECKQEKANIVNVHQVWLGCHKQTTSCRSKQFAGFFADGHSTAAGTFPGVSDSDQLELRRLPYLATAERCLAPR